ncbi:MAG: PAS domain-containing sensor histidine kinase, partial [Eubacteriales bacterium]|nr:PAS domain-containing sensor histidine kinase [Eubacteriales bacterium]MDD3199901.1 PAS domain-containing sensor histidine kinase [Eubacteriales bacterium]MDD4630410.1 PAS domain-containing sensor histidine kinase [Eubacteriales bacterium]
IKQNCYRQLRLVNNMLDMSKIDAGFYKPNLENCNIISVVENTILSVSEYINTKCIELIFNTEVEE